MSRMHFCRYGYTQFKIHLNIPKLNEKAVPWRLTEDPYSYYLSYSFHNFSKNISATHAIYSEHLIGSQFKLIRGRTLGPSNTAHLISWNDILFVLLKWRFQLHNQCKQQWFGHRGCAENKPSINMEKNPTHPRSSYNSI